MKLILLFVAISFFQLSAVESYAQNAKINLSLSDVTLEEAIKTIEANTQFVFFFSNSAVDMTKHVDLNVKNGNIKEVLNQILSSYKYRIEDNKIVLLGEVQQDGKIWGVVSDAFGPIAGANVVVKGTTNGTITDMDGRFSLDAPKGAKLQISYIGYITKELTVDTKTDYVIELVEDSQALEEVVVVGYGTEKKVNVIGSIAQIGSEKLENRSTPQLSNVLTGQMAGVTVIQRSGRPGNSGGEIRVRGVGSFGGESNKSDALVLIDGIPGKLNDVSSEDVESISVLKDASTAAIYGSRAANGVILVTTKTGKEGKVSVGYNGYVGFNTPTALPEFVDTWQYATLYNEAVGREAYTQEEIQKFRDGSDPDHYANARYLDEVFSRKGLQTGHDVTINGGNAENKYMVSFGYLKQNGIVEKNDYQRYNARVNLINEILPGLKLTSRLSGVYGNRKEPMAPGGDDADNMLVLIQKALRFPGLTPTILSDGSFGAGRELHGTPAGWIKSDSFYENPEFSLNANVRLDYNPIKDLQLSAIGAYTYTNGEERTYRSTMKLSGDRVLGPSELKHKMGKTIYKTFQATAEYNKTIGGHTFGILAGYSWEQEDYRYVQGSRDKFPGNDLPYLNAGSPDNQKSEGTGNAWAIQSGFGRLRYNFNERYLFESTVRYDGSSRFPQSKKFGFFPSVAAGWRLSEENFFKENESLGFISNLKLKVSWGRLGNQNIGNYPYQSVYELGQNYPFGDTYTQGAAVTTAVDPTIKWEETETIDGGLEAVFWNGLLSVNASYFNRRTYDILYKPSGSVSTILGQKISEMNTGELKNFGWEFEVGHRNKIGDVSYNVNANLSIIKNKLTTLGVGNVEQLNGMVGNGSDLFIGYPIQMYYGYVSDGVFLDENDIKSWYDQSKVTPNPQPGDIRYKDISGPDGVPDGKIDPNYDRVYLGSRIPKFTFGLNLGVEYKGLDLSVLLQGVAGVTGMLDGFAGWAFRGDGNIQKWQAEGRFDPANPTRYPAYPRLEDLSNSTTPNIVTSDFWTQDASYIRLKNIQLGYTFPKKMLQAAKISNLRVYVQAENPLCWNKYKPGWDPEINTSGNYYPILATYTFGVNFKF
ncbi:SusC/RagA family TonB-linked outer membrane protein [Parabacteroides merdae]|jgi:tonB-linked outer membrane protein, susC/ragA family|nr:TonB-dependent receptor [Parabacteroides merdae]MBS4866183.1 TonB-dependent receptor [Parabacteroides merdae]MDB8934305.1 TonB-dependent receptor [Parabacteroides merdae]MDB8942111.1 TonB-dependent receptor [Parabacteroides merdae]MDB8945567.1 TonB-dependent receptor [Parabacteroides merdae]MDB8949232.1 TonB-dependent receptor [Parabacteroides merdae]